MRKIVILLVGLSVFLFGSELMESTDSKYEQAVKSYKEKDFKNSYEILSKIYISKLSDAKLNFYLGRSAFETGNYEVALAAFERVEMLDPANLGNKLEMARTYFMLKMYEDSELAFKEVLENPNIPQNLRTNIELYLSKVTKVQQKSFTYATVNLDWVYDSNVNYGSIDSQYNINTGTLPGTPEQSDRALQVYADIVNIYDLGDKNGFAFKNRFTLFLKDYQKLDAFDVAYIGYSPSLLYKETKYLVEFVLGLDVLNLADKEYLRTVGFTPRFEYSHTNTLRSISHIKYQKKYFSQSAQYDLNSDHYELAYSLQNILSPRSYIQGNITGIRERKHHGTRIDVDYDEYRANVVYANQFTAIYGTELFAEYRRRNYEDHSTLFGNTRVDNGATAAATVNARILKTLRLHLKGTYNRVESNQDRFSYQKYTITAGLNKTF
ncbi:protein containing Tetratricopeptide repeat (TPR) domain [Sulfurimonas gotlandica GD1]|uniref:Protein containing Tetratricopeptide repeat (TPR) domain n=1 Tax=Sulfurimonas gotlandica (strain DSM 19862 / JCM 16533 / GD1) TaxID=929558 RepID=B6BI99_SULGG|nr:surface lipoprotein assembly modifier [Sulfurimonas gotlandica]EDZ62940.1 tetratricopeptide repeat domain protein [Sulfurimonas gotlandica GD1]EHP30249.1 protein containing Tetratricopeptide repeat (TPR) domain [Sulfurimonas gotlandica GD1]